MPAERGAGPEDRVAADVAIVRDVHVGHEQVAVADRRPAAAAGGAAMDGHELAEDVALADHRAASARRWYFRSCGGKPDRRERVDLGSSPIVVQPSMTADAPMRQFLPSTTSGPITACGPTIVPAPMRAPRIDVRRRIDLRGVRRRTASTSSASATIWPSTSADRAGAHDGAAPAIERHLEAQAVAGHDLPAELGVVHAAQRHAVVGGTSRSSSSSVATCVSDSIISTPGISGVPGNVPGRTLR